MMPAIMTGVVTSLKWRRWDLALTGHPDNRFRDFIVNGVREGFQIGYDYSKHCEPACKNMRSALQNPAVVSDYLLT